MMKDGFSAQLKYYLAASLLLLLASSFSVRAGDKETQSPAEQDPRALKALQDVGAFLRTLKHLHLIAISDTDEVLENGQAVQFSYHTEMIAIPPDKLRVTVTDGPHQKTLFYNGKRFALFDKEQLYYATAEAPPTIDGLLNDMSSRYGIELPLADLFRWNATTADKVGISNALYINDQEVDGRLCAHYAYRQPGVDWQLWVHLGPRPFPCQLVIVRQDTEAMPRHSVRYRWIENQAPPEGAFDFFPPKGVHAVPLRELIPDSPEVRP